MSKQTVIVEINVRRDLNESGVLPLASDVPHVIAEPAEDATEAEWDAYESACVAEAERVRAAYDARDEATSAIEGSYTVRLTEAIWAEGRARGFDAYARSAGSTETPADDQGDTWERIIWQAAWDRLCREDAEAKR